MGLDPVLNEIPEKGNPGEVIYTFYENILNKIVQSKEYPAAVKPNYAFYAQYGIEGIEALVNVIKIYKDEGFPVILDVKRGDIGKTAEAYAKESFEFFNADAVTISPYLGYDSISPFVDNYPDMGYYILTKTSNKSSSEIQDINVGDEPLYMFIANKLVEWYRPGISSVVGATYPDQLLKISKLFVESKKEIPLLIPGIGSQGGSLEEILNILKIFDDYRIHRINSSSAVNYAYKRFDSIDYSSAAVKALKELNDQIGEILV